MDSARGENCVELAPMIYQHYYFLIGNVMNLQPKANSNQLNAVCSFARDAQLIYRFPN